MRGGRLDIIADILSSVKRPKTKTRITREVGLNFNQAGRYLDLLLESALIEIRKGRTRCMG